MASKQEPKSKQEAPEESASKKEQTESSKAIAADGDSPDLDSLLEVLQGDLSEIELDAAIGAIDEWHGILNKQKTPEYKELAGGLKELKQALKGGKASGHDVGDLLSHIGHQTSDLASDAEKGTKQPLQKLGKQLAKVGNSLGQAEDQEQIGQIDTVIDTLERDLSEINTTAASGAIDHWYGLLHKSDNEKLSEIANGLKQLKQAIGGKPKGANIGDLLTQLGEQTTEAASEATRGFKGPIQRLGKLISKAGKSLEKQAAE